MRKKDSEISQSCLILCGPVDCSLPGSSVHGILQARILEWVPSPGDLPDPGIKPRSPALQADALPSEPPPMRPYEALTPPGGESSPSGSLGLSSLQSCLGSRLPLLLAPSTCSPQGGDGAVGTSQGKLGVKYASRGRGVTAHSSLPEHASLLSWRLAYKSV